MTNTTSDDTASYDGAHWHERDDCPGHFRADVGCTPVVPEQIWERCTDCGREYAHPHLCREHMLCGLCHPVLGPA